MVGRPKGIDFVRSRNKLLARSALCWWVGSWPHLHDNNIQVIGIRQPQVRSATFPLEIIKKNVLLWLSPQFNLLARSVNINKLNYCWRSIIGSRDQSTTKENPINAAWLHGRRHVVSTFSFFYLSFFSNKLLYSGFQSLNRLRRVTFSCSPADG